MPQLHELGPVPRFFFARIFPWLLVALGSFTLYLGFDTMYRGWASHRWPTVAGVVTTSKIETESADHAEAIRSRYPEGAEVTVHYHPSRPGNAVLEPGLHGVPWLHLLLGTPCLLFGAGLAFFALRLAARGLEP